MKHIAWCLDNIQIVMGKIPKVLKSQKDKDKANEILDEVQEYINTFEEIIHHPKFKTSLNKLQKSSFKDVQLQEKEIEELFKDLHHALYVTDNYIKELRELIKNHSNSWMYKAKQIVIATVHLMDKKKKKLGKEYTLLQNYNSLLRKRMNQFNNKADQLVLMIDQKFGGDYGELRKEFQVTLHTKEELKNIISSEKHLEELLKQ